MTVPDTAVPDARPVNRHPLASPFVLALWSGLAISLLGDYFYRVALAWNVSDSGHGAFGAGVLGAAMALPIAALGMFGGVLVDRFSRPAAMIATDLIRFTVVAALSILFIAGHPPFYAIIGGAAILSGAGVCFTPAFQAWLPDLLPDRDRLVSFDVVYLSTISAVGVLGPSIAGLLYPAIGVKYLLAFDAISFLASAGAVAFVLRRKGPAPVPDNSPAVGAVPTPPPGMIRGIREGLSYIFGRPELRRQFAVYPFMECAGYAIVFLLPAYLLAAHHAASWLYGAMLAANAGGRLAGAWLLRHSPLRHHRGLVLATNHLIQGIVLIIFCLAPYPLPGLAEFVLMGMPAGASQVALSSWVQVNVERRIRGRAFATLTSFVQWLMPVGPLLYGAIAMAASARLALVATAATLCAGGAVIGSSQAVRSMR